MAVSRVGYCLSKALRACRNWSIEFGCEDVGGYNAGERRDGMTRRCIVCAGVDASCCCTLCNIAINGDDDADVVRGIAM